MSEHATGAIVTERQRCICRDLCVDHCRACNQDSGHSRGCDCAARLLALIVEVLDVHPHADTCDENLGMYPCSCWRAPLNDAVPRS